MSTVVPRPLLYSILLDETTLSEIQIHQNVFFFQVASVFLVIGIIRGVHWALVPWLVIKWMLILILIIFLLADFAIGGVYTQYLSLTSGCVVFALLNWISASITFWQIRENNVKTSAINNLDYINLTNLNPSSDE